MFDFSNFKVFDFSEGQPHMTVTNNGVIFSKGVVAKLNKPQFIALMIDYDGKRIAIKSCNEHIKTSVPFYKSDSQISYVRLASKSLLQEIENLTEWNIKMYKYKIIGTLLRDDNAMLFDLKEATEIF